MAFLLVSSWLPAHRKHADPSNRSTLRAITGEKAPLACKNPKSREESNGKRGRAHPWRPCSSPSCARGPSWTSGRCRRPWWMDPPTTVAAACAVLLRPAAAPAPLRVRFVVHGVGRGWQISPWICGRRGVDQAEFLIRSRARRCGKGGSRPSKNREELSAVNGGDVPVDKESRQHTRIR